MTKVTGQIPDGHDLGGVQEQRGEEGLGSPGVETAARLGPRVEQAQHPPVIVADLQRAEDGDIHIAKSGRPGPAVLPRPPSH
jgi:hypothetical protein